MTELTKLPRFKAPQLDPGSDSDAEWSGYLTVENAAHVAERIRRQFCGRRFSVVSVYESSGWRPELRTGCYVYAGPSVRVDEGRASVSFSAAGTSFGFSTEMESYIPKGFTVMVERGRVWIEFDGRRMTTFEMAPNGLQYRWSFMVEPEYLHVETLITLVKKHELTAGADEATDRVFKAAIQRAEEDLHGE